MTSPAYGITITRNSAASRAAQPSDLSIIGLVLPSDDADASFLPLDEPVLFDSGDVTALTKLGTGDLYKAVSAIDDQLAELQTSARIVAVRVAKGGTDAQTIANIVGSRNALGDGGGVGTGIYALLRAGAELGVIPRLIGAPGYTWQRVLGGSTIITSDEKSGGNTGSGELVLLAPPYRYGIMTGAYQIRCEGGARSATGAAKLGNAGNGVMSAVAAAENAKVGVWRVVCRTAAANGGEFKVIDPTGVTVGIAVVGKAFNGSAKGWVNFLISDGATDFIVGDEFTITVAVSVPANGGVFTVRAPDGALLGRAKVGVPFGKQIAFTIADGATDYVVGDGFDVTVAGDLTELSNPICSALPSVLDTLLAHAIVGGPGIGRNDANDWFEMLGSGRMIPIDAWTIVADGTSSRYEDGVARALGLAARVDFQHGGYPFWSFSGQQVRGILGLKNYYSFSLVDGATQAQALLANHIGVIVRGEIGVETAIASNGFVFAGVWTASTDPAWWFYNKSRARDWIDLALLKSIRLRLGVDNVNAHAVQAVLNDMAAVNMEALRNGGSIGFKVEFAASANSPENLGQGRFRVAYYAETPAPITRVDIDSYPFSEALTAELAALVAQAATIQAQFAS
jgi:phage tail sheath protein FI